MSLCNTCSKADVSCPIYPQMIGNCVEYAPKGTIYQQALDKFGEDEQMEMVVEECAELTVAIKHFKRGRVGREKLAEELADNAIMLEQMKIVVGPKLFNAAINAKLDRLKQTINGEQ